MTDSQTISLRVASDRDATVIEKLSALDSKPALHAPAVVALVDGRPVAAASLSDASVVADPFVPTADLVEMLRVHAAGERSTGRSRRRWLPLPPRQQLTPRLV
jgi:hypothetical protein